MQEFLVGSFEDLPDQGCKLTEQGGVEIGLFRLDKEVFAWRNVCAHSGGPVCQGRVFPKVVGKLGDDQVFQGLRYSEDELHIVCPWHGYEYSIRTGRNSGRAGLGLTPIEVSVRSGSVYVRV